jgi:hypothetical protein
MSTYRSFLVVLSVFALALAGLGAGALAAWVRCDGGGCQGELALGIVALAPAALLLSTALLLLRAKGDRPRRDRLLASLACAIAVTPLVTFVLWDVMMVIAVSGLFGALVLLLLTYREREEPDVVRAAPPMPAPARPAVTPTPVDDLWDVQVTSVHAVAARRRDAASTALSHPPERERRDVAAHRVAAAPAAALPPPSLVPLEAAMQSLDARMRELRVRRLRR